MINFPMEVSTGDMYFYAGIGPNFMIRNIYVMDEPVGIEHLQKAVDTAMRRYPYFRVKAVLNGSTYSLEANDLPFVVYEGSEFIAPGDPRINGHLISFACNGNEIYIDFFHGLTDGRGALPLVRSVFYYYGVFQYGEQPEMKDVQLADDPLDPAELLDPIRMVVPELKPFSVKVPTSAYKLPEDKCPKDAPQILYPISVPQKEFMRYVKSIDGSPAAVAALFLCKTVDAVHPEHEEPIVCGMAADFRSDLGCPKTFRNCCGSISLEYQPALREMSLDRQTTVFRGKIMLQSAAESLLPDFAKKQKEYAMLEHLPSVKDKRMAMIRDLLKAPVTVNCSYEGKVDLGSMEKHIQVKHIYSKFGGSGIVIEITALGEFFGIDFLCDVESDVYIKEFIHQLELAGIPLELGEPISYQISSRCF